MSPSDFIKNILNIQDNNISFPEENYLQIIKKKDFFIKVFKGLLKSNHYAFPHCNSKNIVKNGSRIRKVKYIPYQNYNIELELTVHMFETNITNRVIEGLNNKIKSIKRTAFGYSKFSNFKKHILIQEGIVSINA